MSFYWKARTLISGDYRELERNFIQYKNKKVIEKYKGKEEIYCVCRLFSDEGGLFCLFLKALAGISYSIQNGFIPVIDMQTKENIFVSKQERKTINVWECFFEQPAGISYEDVKNKPNKIILENPTGPNELFKLMMVEDTRKYWTKLCEKYIHYAEPVKMKIQEYEHLFEEQDKVLGVLARGTDYLNPGVGHAVQPSIEQIIEAVRKILNEHHCNKIFLATEDINILNALKLEFQDSLLYIEQKRYQGEQHDKLGHLKDYHNGAIEMNQSYLAAIHYLAKSDCFFGGMTTGTIGVYILGGEFLHFDVFYQGTHGVSDKNTLQIDKL